MSNDFINRIPQALMPDGDILHTDTVARNTRFAAARTGRENNMLRNERRDMLFVGRGRVFHRVNHTEKRHEAQPGKAPVFCLRNWLPVSVKENGPNPFNWRKLRRQVTPRQSLIFSFWRGWF